MFLPHHAKRTTSLQPFRKLKFRRQHVRLAVFCVAFVVVCVTVTFTLRALKSRPLVIKLHDSEERFVQDVLQEVVLLPKKRAPTPSPALALREKCHRLYRGKCPPCSVRSKTSQSEAGKQFPPVAAGKKGVDGAGGAGQQLPAPKDAWPSRRRQWWEDEELRRLRQLLASHTSYWRSIDLMHTKPPPRLLNFKNPCFWASPRTMTQCTAGPFNTWRRLAHSYDRGAVLDKNQRRLSCLPYFVILGPPKSGAPELLSALSRHPDVTHPLPVQSNWLDSARFDPSCASVNTYLDFFDMSTQAIYKNADENRVSNMITGEVAETLLWDNHLWPVLPGNEGQLEPRFTNADYLYHLDPSVKVIVILRNPVERVFQEYQEHTVRVDLQGASAEDFHSRVKETVQGLKACLSTQPPRACLYDGLHQPPEALVRIRSGMYAVMLQDWLRVFPRDQVHVIHYETFQRRTRIELIKLVKFLGLKGVTLEQIDSMLQRDGGKRTKRKKEEEKHGEEKEEAIVEDVEEEEGGGRMLEETREMLNGFYRPFNRLLATVLEDDAFLWEG